MHESGIYVSSLPVAFLCYSERDQWTNTPGLPGVPGVYFLMETDAKPYIYIYIHMDVKIHVAIFYVASPCFIIYILPTEKLY